MKKIIYLFALLFMTLAVSAGENNPSNEIANKTSVTSSEIIEFPGILIVRHSVYSGHVEINTHTASKGPEELHRLLIDLFYYLNASPDFRDYLVWVYDIEAGIVIIDINNGQWTGNPK